MHDLIVVTSRSSSCSVKMFGVRCGEFRSVEFCIVSSIPQLVQTAYKMDNSGGRKACAQEKHKFTRIGDCIVYTWKT